MLAKALGIVAPCLLAAVDISCEAALFGGREFLVSGLWSLVSGLGPYTFGPSPMTWRQQRSSEYFVGTVNHRGFGKRL